MTWRQFQQWVCKELSEHGFWAYETINKPSGQPADILAAKSNVAYLIECKVTKADRFPLSRVEDNQITSIQLFNKCGCTESWFAFFFAKHPDNVLFVRAGKIIALVESGAKSTTYEELKDMSELLLEKEQ